ncbi:unnamed protein product [Dibothriocephalus latus]|uniref:Uncharacterized protein n=1 Tax=Dibothriocephalus latus TaxID=60516 RepID=A0A3P7LIJ6_DIBLA|nr:unnamed protein product [Dibothriocephalus latus]
MFGDSDRFSRLYASLAPQSDDTPLSSDSAWRLFIGWLLYRLLYCDAEDTDNHSRLVTLLASRFPPDLTDVVSFVDPDMALLRLSQRLDTLKASLLCIYRAAGTLVQTCASLLYPSPVPCQTSAFERLASCLLLAPRRIFEQMAQSPFVSGQGRVATQPPAYLVETFRECIGEHLPQVVLPPELYPF